MTAFNPFPGLRPFEPEEDHLFFGREKEIDELLRRLRSTRFLSVVGTSGSGKSSLVRSGLIPSLHSGFMVTAGSSWRIAIFRPGENPIGKTLRPLSTSTLSALMLTTEGACARTSELAAISKVAQAKACAERLVSRKHAESDFAGMQTPVRSIVG